MINNKEKFEYEKINLDFEKIKLINKCCCEISKEEGPIYILKEEGWIPEDAGIWDPTTREATIKIKEKATIKIDTDYVFLTGLQRDNSKSIIDGCDLLTVGLYIKDRQNINISNINISNCNCGLWIENSKKITINNVNIENCSEKAIYISKSRDIKINNNLINTATVGIVLSLENSYIDIRDNNIYCTNIGMLVGENNSFNIIENNQISKIKNNENFIGIIFNGLCNNYNTLRYNNIFIGKTKVEGENIYISAMCFCNYDVVENYNNSSEFNNVLDNNILIFDNSIMGYGEKSNINISGIVLLGDSLGNSTISGNEITIKNNEISFNEDIQEVLSYIEGIILNSSFGKLNIDSNKIFIENNNFLKKTIKNFNMNCYVDGILSCLINRASNIINSIINISNNFIISNNEEIYYKTTGINLYEDNTSNILKNNKINIEDNVVSGKKVNYYGIYFYKGNLGNIIEGNTILLSNNIASKISAIYFSLNNYGNKIIGNILKDNHGIGIFFEKNNNNNFISKNDISYTLEDAIYLKDENNFNIIKGNIIKGSKEVGIYFNKFNRNNDITENEIKNNLQSALYLNEGNAYNTIEYNEIFDNSNDGIYLNSTNNFNNIEYNFIKYNEEYGIFIDDGENNDNVIFNNNVVSNVKGLYLGNNSINNIIRYNTFINGENSNSFNRNSLNLFFSNYWSDWNKNNSIYDINMSVDLSPSRVRLNKNELFFV